VELDLSAPQRVWVVDEVGARSPQRSGPLVHDPMRVSDVTDGEAYAGQGAGGIPAGEFLAILAQLRPGLRSAIRVEAGLLELLLVPGQAVDIEAHLRIAPHRPLAVIGDGGRFG